MAWARRRPRARLASPLRALFNSIFTTRFCPEKRGGFPWIRQALKVLVKHPADWEFHVSIHERRGLRHPSAARWPGHTSCLLRLTSPGMSLTEQLGWFQLDPEGLAAYARVAGPPASPTVSETARRRMDALGSRNHPSAIASAVCFRPGPRGHGERLPGRTVGSSAFGLGLSLAEPAVPSIAWEPAVGEDQCEAIRGLRAAPSKKLHMSVEEIPPQGEGTSQLQDQGGLLWPPLKATVWEGACPYVEGFRGCWEFLWWATVPPGWYESALANNWRRSGDYFYRPICQECSECRTLRVLAPSFRRRGSLARCWRRNADLQVVAYREHRPTSCYNYLRNNAKNHIFLVLFR
jgi:hypothetical protein